MGISVGTLFASLVVSSVGFGVFTYGKAQARVPQILVGIVLMAFPYFVSGPLAMCSIAVGLLLALSAAVRFGM